MSEAPSDHAPDQEAAGATGEVAPVAPTPEIASAAESPPGHQSGNQRVAALAPGASNGDSRPADERPDVAARAEENLYGAYDATTSQARQVRDDIPTGDAGADFTFGDQATTGHIAGRDMFHYYSYTYNYANEGQDRARGPISVSALTQAARVHVHTASDATLRARCAADRIVVLRGRLESGRRSSAVTALDQLTSNSRRQSLVSVVEATSGPGGLAGRLAAGHGHLLDASAEDWFSEISEAQLSEISEALDQGKGYLIVLATAGSAPPSHVTVVEHEPPDPGRVVRSHLADRMAGAGEITEASFAAGEALLRDALGSSAEGREWYEELTAAGPSGTVASPAEAVHLALAIAEWGEQAPREPTGPRIRHYRNLRLYGQARVLLGRGDRSDSPLRQAYVIATAALDGLAVSEVADQARHLATLLDEAEGGSRKRRVFAETLTHWLGHADMAASVSEGNQAGAGVAVVRLPSRKLARTIVEVAWLDYDAARVPLRKWLVRLCSEHRDPRVRIRGAQALAFIAARDYPYVKSKVLDPWSESERPIEHQAAAWLLEAVTVGDPKGGRMKRQVEDLLRRWSRSGQWQKRAIAVRAYGTRIGTGVPEAALSGIRISAADPSFGTLPELALSELYADGLRKTVLQELVFWTHAFPVMRERVGRALVRVSWVRHADQPGTFDLLWRMAHSPASAGIGLDALGLLWKIACEQEGSRAVAWKMLGLWARSCRSDPTQRHIFVQIADIFESSVDRPDLRERFGVHRRQWNDYLDQEGTR